MKIFNLITLKEFKQDISDVLKTVDNIKMFNFCSIEEHSDHRVLESKLEAIDLVVGYTEKIKLETIVRDENIQEITDCLFKISGLEQESYYWIVNIEKYNFKSAKKEQ